MNPEQVKSLIQLWRASLLSVSESMPPSPRQIADPHRNSLRKLAGESIAPEKLAEILDLHPRVMQKIEAGDSNPKSTTLIRIQAALGCSWESRAPKLSR